MQIDRTASNGTSSGEGKYRFTSSCQKWPEDKGGSTHFPHEPFGSFKKSWIMSDVDLHQFTAVIDLRSEVAQQISHDSHIIQPWNTVD